MCGSPAVTRLGDKIEAGLTSLGITKERVAGLLASIGLPSTCGGCDNRQEWLNQADEKLGLGEKLDAFKNWMGWK